MPRFHRVNSARIQFTAEEESARDAEEAQVVIDKTARDIKDARTAVLRAKLDDETITLAELIELSKGKL
jgi:hypothetical protein